MSRPLRVVKVGGSLLDQPGTGQKLAVWVEHAGRDERLLLIAGGGVQVERLRSQSVSGKLGNEEAHWQAIATMDHNAHRLAEVLQAPMLTLSRDAPQGCLAIAAVLDFLRDVEPTLSGRRLPTGWHVTSDSIAARIAEIYDARLTLLKSRKPQAPAGDMQRLAEAGFVDEFFPTASLGLRQVIFDLL